jgi:hypothetical protein
MWCRLGNKQKNEGKYRRPLEKKLCFIKKRLAFGRTNE